MKTTFWRSLFLTLFMFGLFGWIYIAVNAEVHPWTLSMPLTHFASWPREDTFGAVCFVVSMISFFIWNLIRERK
jgi:hypothetical protein